MLAPAEKKAQAEQRKERQRQATRTHRQRLRQGIAIYLVGCNSAVLDWLVREHYLTDADVLDKTRVSRALSAALYDISRA